MSIFSNEFKMVIDVLIEWSFWVMVYGLITIGILATAYMVAFAVINRKQAKKRKKLKRNFK